MEKGKLVTFFVLHKNEGVKPYSNNIHAILLRAFSTDFRYQGMGYAKKALMLLPPFVKVNFKEINEIVLAVNVQNVVAQKLYQKCGFIDNGVRKMGKKGELIIMSYYL
jgi:RimJ/RimL family protein N-acetyltransferase